MSIQEVFLYKLYENNKKNHLYPHKYQQFKREKQFRVKKSKATNYFLILSLRNIKQLLFQMLFEQIFQNHNILVHFLSKMAQQAQSSRKKFEERKKKRNNQFIMKQFTMTSSQIIQFSRQLKRGLLNESFHLLLNLQKPRGASGIEILRYLHGNAMINDQQRQYMSQQMRQQRISSYCSNHSHISSKSSFSNNEKNQDEEIVTIIPNYVFNQIWEIKEKNYDSYFANIEKSQSGNNKIQFMKQLYSTVITSFLIYKGCTENLENHFHENESQF